MHLKSIATRSARDGREFWIISLADLRAWASERNLPLRRVLRFALDSNLAFLKEAAKIEGADFNIGDPGDAMLVV